MLTDLTIAWIHRTDGGWLHAHPGTWRPKGGREAAWEALPLCPVNLEDWWLRESSLGGAAPRPDNRTKGAHLAHGPQRRRLSTLITLTLVDHGAWPYRRLCLGRQKVGVSNEHTLTRGEPSDRLSVVAWNRRWPSLQGVNGFGGVPIPCSVQSR